MTQLRQRVERLESAETTSLHFGASANAISSFPGMVNIVAGSGVSFTPGTGTLTITATGGVSLPREIRKDFHSVSAGDELYAYVSGPLSLTGVSILAKQSGNLVVDVRRTPIGSFPATSGDSICAAAKPTLATAQTYLDTTLTGWSTSSTEGDTLTIHVDSVTTVTDFEITLYGQSVILPLVITGHLPDATIGDMASYSYTVTGGYGTTTVTIYSGALPAGASISTAGAVSGTYTTAGSYSWVLQVEDSLGSKAYLSDSNAIAYATLSSTGALTDADIGGPVGGSITLSGGDGTYTVDALPVSGTRPAGNGLALVGPVYSDSSGVTTTLGSYSWTDRFRSGDGQTLDVPSSVEVSVAGDPYWSDVSALLHCNSMTGSTIPDETGKTWTAYNAAAITVFQSMFGGASLSTPNASGGNYVSTPSDADFSMGSGDFTIELWARYTPNGNGNKGLVVCDGVGATRGWLLFLQDVTGTLGAPAFYAWVGGTPYGIDLGTALTVDTWTNIVVVRDGGTLRMYINGVQQGSTAISGTVNDAAQPCAIGTLWGSGIPFSGTYFNGFIDEVRVTKGVCRYPSGTTFTPQALEWPNS